MPVIFIHNLEPSDIKVAYMRSPFIYKLRNSQVKPFPSTGILHPASYHARVATLPMLGSTIKRYTCYAAEPHIQLNLMPAPTI